MSIPTVNIRKRKLKSGKTSFFIDYRVEGKRYRQSVGYNKHTAERIRAELQHKLALGQFDILTNDKEKFSFNRLTELYFQSKTHLIRPQSLHRYKNYIQKLRDFLKTSFPLAYEDISRIDSLIIKEHINILSTRPMRGGKPWAPKTIGDYINAIRMLFKYAVENEFLDKNPAEKIQKPKILKKAKAPFYSDTELNAIIEQLDPFWIDYIKFLALTGLRKGELINLKWTAVDIQSNAPSIEIKSDGDWITKTGEDRIVPLHQKAVSIIKKQFKAFPNSIYAFPDKKGQKQRSDPIYRAFNKAAEKVGITEAKIHNLRHTFASNMIMNNGASLYDVQKLLGHSDIKSTEIYSHLTSDHLYNVVNKSG